MTKKLKPIILLLFLAFIFSCSNQNNEEKVHELMLKAREYNALSDFDKVIEITKECLEIDPENAEAYFMMGNALVTLIISRINENLSHIVDL